MPYSLADEEAELAKKQEEIAKLQSNGPVSWPTPQPTHTIASVGPASKTSDFEPLPIVYLYIIGKSQCREGLPSYLIDTVSQAVTTQVYIIP